MPLPSDERIVSLANEILAQFDSIFGLHPGFRPAHAKGILLSGTFTPAPTAAALTKAPHLLRPATPVSVRFSNSTGLPLIPDNAADANPRGLAIRFHLAEHVHTDIVSHSTNGFPVRNGDDFLELLRAVASSGPDVPSPKPIELFLQKHPEALAFISTPKPFAKSFATQPYFAVTAFAFTNSDNVTRYGRYQIRPLAGSEYFGEQEAAALDSNYHFAEIQARLKEAPVRFSISVQVALPEDQTDDATVHWPESREEVELGTLELTEAIPENLAEQKKIIFDPIPRVDGIAPSADPLLELRAAIYLLSGRRRRQAPLTAPA